MKRKCDPNKDTQDSDSAKKSRLQEYEKSLKDANKTLQETERAFRWQQDFRARLENTFQDLVTDPNRYDVRSVVFFSLEQEIAWAKKRISASVGEYNASYNAFCDATIAVEKIKKSIEQLESSTCQREEGSDQGVSDCRSVKDPTVGPSCDDRATSPRP